MLRWFGDMCGDEDVADIGEWDDENVADEKLDIELTLFFSESHSVLASFFVELEYLKECLFLVGPCRGLLVFSSSLDTGDTQSCTGDDDVLHLDVAYGEWSCEEEKDDVDDDEEEHEKYALSFGASVLNCFVELVVVLDFLSDFEIKFSIKKADAFSDRIILSFSLSLLLK